MLFKILKQHDLSGQDSLRSTRTFNLISKKFATSFFILDKKVLKPSIENRVKVLNKILILEETENRIAKKKLIKIF